MSYMGAYPGAVQLPKPVRLTTTSSTDIKTATDDIELVGAISFANETGSAVASVLCHYYDGTTDFLVFSAPVPAYGTVVMEGMPIKLKSGDKIKVTASTANAITVTPIVSRIQQNDKVSWSGR